MLFPWTGSRIHRTLLHILAHLGWYSRDQTYYIAVVYSGTAAALCAELREISIRVPELVEGKVKEMKDAELWRGKYDYLTPRSLLEKAYINDVLDIPGTMRWLEICS